MSTREYFYNEDELQGFQELTFETTNNNPVEIELNQPVEYSVTKVGNHHAVRIVIDKKQFTALAKKWLASVNCEP